MHAVADNSVALVVTSPPYFAGKQYEEELGRDGVPSSYLEYLDLLRDVFAECVRVLEPGGRIAVNVANLGRKPYRSLAADVVSILGDELGLLLRGEIVWRKAEGATGSCAWGSYRSAANPVLRDLTERVVVACKGRFDRALTPAQRQACGLPHESTLGTDDFLSLTLDVWEIAPESARRVGHPAPFPVELPEALIRLYTYAGDLVLDPFMGSGSTLVAAARLGRRYVGYDLDPTYVELARRRVEAEGQVLAAADERSALQIAEDLLVAAGFTLEGRKVAVRPSGTVADLVASDPTGAVWHVLVGGPNTSHAGGLRRTETVWRIIGRAASLRAAAPEVGILVITSASPAPGTEGAQALRAVTPAVVHAVIDMTDPGGLDRLRALGRTR